MLASILRLLVAHARVFQAAARGLLASLTTPGAHPALPKEAPASVGASRNGATVTAFTSTTATAGISSHRYQMSSSSSSSSSATSPYSMRVSSSSTRRSSTTSTNNNNNNSSSGQPRMRNRTIHLLYGTGGGGHRASAEALQYILRLVAPAIDVRLVNASAIAGATPGDALYNLFLSYNAISLIEVLHLCAVAFLPVARPLLRASFKQFWTSSIVVDGSVDEQQQQQQQQPSSSSSSSSSSSASSSPPHAVVSFVPMLNGVFAEALPHSTKLFTVLTDFSHTSGHPWLQHHRQHVVAGTHLAHKQAVNMGWIPGTNLTHTSGMVVHPSFGNAHAQRHVQAVQYLRKHGLDTNLPTALLLFGANPPTADFRDLFMALALRHNEQVASVHAHARAQQQQQQQQQQSQETPSKMNVIAVCGKNDSLRRTLRAAIVQHGMHANTLVLGFTKDLPILMRASSVMYGKPGPGVVSEAYVSALPIVIIAGDKDSAVMAQEKDVLKWVRATGVGLVVRNLTEAARVSTAQIQLMKENITKLPQNLAVFQVAGLLAAECDVKPAVDLHLQHESSLDRDVRTHAPGMNALMNSYREAMKRIRKERAAANAHIVHSNVEQDHARDDDDDDGDGGSGKAHSAQTSNVAEDGAHSSRRKNR